MLGLVRTADARADATLYCVNSGSVELVFLVRMWVQGAQNPDEPEWRGSVQEVASGRRLYVAETRDIAEFIAARMAEHASRAR